MSALPKAVQDQVEQVEALQKQLYPEDVAPAQAAEPPVAEEPVSNVVELPKQQAPVQEAQPESKEQSADYWRSRFDTLRGKFDAEVPALHQQLKEQQRQLSQLMDQMAEKQKAPEPEEKSLVSDKDVEDYGNDLIDMVRRVATEVVGRAVSAEIAKIRKEVGTVQQQVGEVSEHVVQSAADRFWGQVKSLVADWEVIDKDPRWIEWLDTAPEFSEETYRQLAGVAIQKGNAQKIAALVGKWKQELGLDKPPVQAKPELQRQVSPSSVRAAAPVQPAGKIWSRAEYERAFDHRWTSATDPSTVAQVQAEADRAVAEGRVRW